MTADPARSGRTQCQRAEEAHLIDAQRPGAYPVGCRQRRRRLQRAGRPQPGHAVKKDADGGEWPAEARRHRDDRHRRTGEQRRGPDDLAAVHPAAQAGHQEARGHRAHAHRTQHQSKGLRSQRQILADQQRQQPPDRGAEQEKSAGAQDCRLHRRRRCDEAQPGAHGGEEMLGWQGTRWRLALPQQQRHRQRQDAHRVEGEGRRRAEARDDQPAHRRPQGTGDVEADAVERDGADEILPRDQFGRRRRPAGEAHRQPSTQREGKGQQSPGAQRAAQVQHAQAQRHGRQPALGQQQEGAPVHDVSQRAGRHREQKDRQHRRRLHQRHHHGRRIERGHQPARTGVLHPQADVGGEVGDPQHAEGGVAERREGPGRRHHARMGRGGAGCNPNQEPRK